jgi:hypothetical protein
MQRLLRGILVLAAILMVSVFVAYAAGLFEGRKCAISGTITRDGKPLEWPSDQGHFLVIFVPEDRGPNDDPVLAESDRATGTYRIAEIKSGRYMVAIHQFDARHMDALQNKYDPVKTPVRVDVTDDGQVIDIDLPKELPR